MKMLAAAALLAAVVSAAPASATVVFSDNFDSYPASQVPWAGNGVWTTGNGVDLVKSGDYGLMCAFGTGNCVDLSGSAPGSISHSLFLTPGRYNLSFDFTGNQLDAAGGPRPQVGFTAAIDSFSHNTGPLSNSSSTFSSYASDFVISSAGNYLLSFTQDVGGDPYRGSIVDNVSVSAVPEPAAWALMILGFGVVGGTLRRRRQTLAAA